MVLPMVTIARFVNRCGALPLAWKVVALWLLIPPIFNRFIVLAMFRFVIAKRLFLLVLLLWMALIVAVFVLQTQGMSYWIKTISLFGMMLTPVLFYLAVSVVFSAMRISSGLSAISKSEVENQLETNPLIKIFLVSDYEHIISQKKQKYKMKGRS